MNAANHIVKAFYDVIEKLIFIIGKWGSSAPVDDSKSGIKIGDKIYQVVVSWNGCYWYLDENGKKHPVAEIPNNDFEWVNIAEKVIKELRTCYRTPGGKVEIWSWYLINDQMDTLKEQHRITDSLDIDYPIGTLLTEIPADWVMIDCDFPEMTERDVTFIKRCYKTPNGKVEIEGIEAIDDKLNIRESLYRVLQTTDSNFPAGYEFTTIPSDWVRMVCDFPDMTERDVTYVLECYTTSGGKVQVEGLEAIDNILGVRESIYTVIQSTDEAIAVGSTYQTIPEDWVRMVCDFPDMTDREIVEVNECYSTGKGKVEITGYQAVDAELGVREQYYYIVNTTDPDYPEWTRIERIPNEWKRTICDFPDLTERHVLKVNECYITEGGKVHIGGYRSVDGILGIRAEYLLVMETTDPDIQRGATYDSIPDGWDKVVCDFPDMSTADTEIIENCYKSENGKVQLRSYVTFDGEGGFRGSRHVVLKSTDESYKLGQELSEIPVSWISIDCDFASLTERHIIPFSECYHSEDGDIYVEGQRLLDNLMEVHEMSATVLESSVEALPVGTVLTEIPSGMVKVVCLCRNC